jgi:hypothetical protein
MQSISLLEILAAPQASSERNSLFSSIERTYAIEHVGCKVVLGANAQSKVLKTINYNKHF